MGGWSFSSAWLHCVSRTVVVAWAPLFDKMLFCLETAKRIKAQILRRCIYPPYLQTICNSGSTLLAAIIVLACSVANSVFKIWILKIVSFSNFLCLFHFPKRGTTWAGTFRTLLLLQVLCFCNQDFVADSWWCSSSNVPSRILEFGVFTKLLKIQFWIALSVKFKNHNLLIA